MKALKYLNPFSIHLDLLAISLLMAHVVSAQITAGTKPIYSIEFKPVRTLRLSRVRLGHP